MKKEDMRVSRTKLLLKQSLLEVLKDKSFDKITVSEICDKAFVNRVTFYLHYQDKYDLFNDYMKDVLADIYQKSILNLHEEKNDKSQIVEFCQNIFDEVIELIVSKKDVLKSLKYEENSLVVFMMESMACDSLKELFSKIEGHLNTKYPLEFIIAFIVGGISKMVQYWFMNCPMVEVEEIKQHANRIIQDAIEKNIFMDMEKDSAIRLIK